MEITIYHQHDCAFCKTEMQWLDSKGVSYNTKNIDEDEEAKKYIQEETGRLSVPVTTIAKDKVTTIVYGFDRFKLAEAIGIEA